MKKITVRLASLLLVFTVFGFTISDTAAQRKITGTIYSDGKPAAGARVTAHKVSNEVWVSFDGKYEIDVHAKSKFLKVYFNDENQKIELGDGNTYDVYFGKKPSAETKTETKTNTSGRDMRTAAELKGDENYIKHVVYVDDYKLKKYDLAYPNWKYIFDTYPNSSRNIYSHGATMLGNMILKENDEAKKQKLIDELMGVYDQRIEFGLSPKYTKGYVLGRKGKDLLQYKKEDVDKAYKILGESLELQKENSEDAVVVVYMLASQTLYRDEKIEAGAVVEDYVKCMDILDKRLANAKGESETSKIQTAVDGVERLFAESGAATCPDLVKIFTPRFDENPKDKDLLKKITKLLDKSDCTDEDLFAKAATNLYPLEPSAQAAYSLARTYVKKGDLKQAAKYYEEAANMEEKDSLKAKYYYYLGLVSLDNYQKAYSCALKAKKLRPEWGEPIILIGRAYIAGKEKCGTKKIEHQAAYWFAVDKFAQAKALDPSVAKEANKLINEISQHFPNKEDLFMEGLLNKPYSTINNSGCWIKEKTTARPRK